MANGPTDEPAHGPLEIPTSDGHGTVAAAPKIVHSSGDLRVTRTDQIDFGRKRGVLEYVYRFARYELCVGEQAFSARRYADTWEEVAILTGPGGRFDRAPYEDPSFSVVAEYFLAQADVATVMLLTPDGYVAIELPYVPPG